MNLELKVKPHHPAKKFQVGRHTLSQAYKEFSLNKEEKKELESIGCKTWVDIKGVKEVKQKTEPVKEEPIPVEKTMKVVEAIEATEETPF